MRVILDECLPRRLGLELTGHLVATVPQAGWAGIANGKLFLRIQGSYDAFITIDKNLPSQQETAGLSFNVVVPRAASNKLDELRPLIPHNLVALETLRPGQVVLLPEA